MKKLLLFVTMAASLLFTQCKKEESVSSAGKTVSMTVTAGPGSKTDITENGAITWSDGDQLYVGDGSKYIGYLTIASGVGTPTGTFTGNVTLPTDTKDGEKSFGFFYLGSNPPEVASSATSVDVSFAEQTGLLGDLGSCHVGYGSAMGTVVGNVVTDINVTMLSKVAIARFCFTKENSKEAYEGALTLKGDNICNKMTVNFNSEVFACTGTKGDISLTNTTTSEKYVMLVPTSETTGEQTLTFAGDNVSGSYTLANGIEANKFYGLTGAIAVTLEAAAPAGRFTVDANGTKVDFAPGNLWYGKAGDDETAAFHFETNQWGTQPASNGLWNASHVSHFFWSKSASVAYAGSYSESGTTTSDVFFTNSSSFQVAGETAGTWRTLSKAEWDYLLNSRSTDASSLRAWKELDDGEHKGLVILPDGTDVSVMSSISSTADLATYGAVFLPASGYRYGSRVYSVGSLGRYWSSTPLEGNEGYAYLMNFDSGGANTSSDSRSIGFAVRLVR